MHRDAGVTRVKHLTTGLAGASLASVIAIAGVAHHATVDSNRASRSQTDNVTQPDGTGSNSDDQSGTNQATAPKTTTTKPAPKPTQARPDKAQAATSGGS